MIQQRCSYHFPVSYTCRPQEPLVAVNARAVGYAWVAATIEQYATADRKRFTRVAATGSENDVTARFVSALKDLW